MTGRGDPQKPEAGSGVMPEKGDSAGAAYRPISVIIPTFNRRKWLDEILASLVIQTLPFEQFEVIIVDDGSKDETSEITKKVFPFQVRYFYQTNQGDAAARNLGAAQSQAEYLVFLDDDIILEKDFLANLVAEHQGQPNRIIVGADALWVEETNPMSVGAVPPSPGGPAVEPIPFADVCSNNMSIRREAYFAVGMMEGLGFSGSSIWCDVDFTYRAAQKQFEFLRSRRALCWHRDYVAKNFQTRKKRMREVAYRAVVLFQKYPDLIQYLPMFDDKTPIQWQKDGTRLIVRKLVRKVASTGLALRGLEWMLRLGVERLDETLRTWIVGGYIYRGYREGLRDFGPVKAPSRATLLSSVEKNS